MSTTRDGSGLRKRQRNGFAAVPNETVWDDELPARALGVLTKLIALPEEWKLDTGWLVEKCGGDGREAVMTALRALRRLGYYRVERRRLAGGKFVTGVSVSDVRLSEWAEQHAQACRDQNTDKPKWDVTLRVLDDGRIEDEPARGPADKLAGQTGNGFTDSGETGDRNDRTPVQPVTGEPVVRTQTETQTETQTPLPSGGAPAADDDEQLRLVDAPAKPAKPKRRHTIPKDWVASPELLAKAAEKVPGVDVQAESRKFWAHHDAQGGKWLDWDKAFLGTWMGNVRPPRPGPYRDRPRTTQHHAQQQIGSPASDGWDDFLQGGLKR